MLNKLTDYLSKHPISHHRNGAVSWLKHGVHFGAVLQNFWSIWNSEWMDFQRCLKGTKVPAQALTGIQSQAEFLLISSRVQRELKSLLKSK